MEPIELARAYIKDMRPMDWSNRNKIAKAYIDLYDSIVRCGECRRSTYGRILNNVYCRRFENDMHPDEFCSGGEKEVHDAATSV